MLGCCWRRKPAEHGSTLQRRVCMTRNVLFLCSQNRLRSPTAEQVFADWPGIETASPGLLADAEEALSPELLQWADLVFVMERRSEEHTSELQSQSNLVCRLLLEKKKKNHNIT